MKGNQVLPQRSTRRGLRKVVIMFIIGHLYESRRGVVNVLEGGAKGCEQGSEERRTEISSS